MTDLTQGSAHGALEAAASGTTPTEKSLLVSILAEAAGSGSLGSDAPDSAMRRRRLVERAWRLEMDAFLVARVLLWVGCLAFSLLVLKLALGGAADWSWAVLPGAGSFGAVTAATLALKTTRARAWRKGLVGALRDLRDERTDSSKQERRSSTRAGNGHRSTSESRKQKLDDVGSRPDASTASLLHVVTDADLSGAHTDP
jgi:hypothetical protein